MSLGAAPVKAFMKWADRVVGAVLVSVGGALLVGALLSVAQMFAGLLGVLWRD